MVANLVLQTTGTAFGWCWNSSDGLAGVGWSGIGRWIYVKVPLSTLFVANPKQQVSELSELRS